MKLHVAHLNKTFGDQKVLTQIHLAFQNVQSLVLVGPSGGGKSTLMRILAGLEYPDFPTLATETHPDPVIEINDRPVIYHEKELAAYRRTIGTVFQAYNLFPHLTALQNVTLPLEKVHQLAPDAAREIAENTLKRFGLSKHMYKKPFELSGGQRQRVAIVRAIAIKPKLLFFDEPTSALDPEMTHEVLEVIEELKNEGRDFVLVTHEISFARRVADQVALLVDGNIIESGTAAQVFDSPIHEVSQKFFTKVLRH